MKKELKQRIPMWYEDITQYELCLTDDIDSLLSCVFLKEKFWTDIRMFYTFSKMYKQVNIMEKIKEWAKNNKGLAIVILLSLVLLIVLIIMSIQLFIGGSSSKYGNRLDGINDVKMDY